MKALALRIREHWLVAVLVALVGVFLISMIAATGMFGIVPTQFKDGVPSYRWPWENISISNPFNANQYTTDPASAKLDQMVSPQGRIEVLTPAPETTTSGNPLKIEGTFAGDTDAVKIEIFDAGDLTKSLFGITVKPRKTADGRSSFSTSVAWSKAQTVEVRISILDAQNNTEHVRFKVTVGEPLAPLVAQ